MKNLFVLLECVVVMFWNVENFFDPFKADGKNDGDFTPRGAKHWTWKQFEKKRNGIGKTIIATADSTGALPALIGLAEVENAMVVSQIVRHSPLSEVAQWGYIHRESPDERGIDVALIFRKDAFRVLHVDSLRIEEFATRDILYVKGILERIDTVHVLVNHWPSQLGGKKSSDHRRESARKVLEKTVDSIRTTNADASIIVMGDFNTEEPDVHLHHPPTTFNEMGTIKYRGRWEKIDHFYTSGHLLDDAREKIFNAPFLLEEDKTFLDIKPRRTFIGPRNNGGLSDHLPVLLTFISKKANPLL